MKRPGIPSAGVAYLRSVTEDGMVDSIAIRRPAQPSYDSATGYATGVTSGTSGYTGKAHIHPQQGQAGIEPGEGMVAMVTVQITIPFDALPTPRVDDQVYVTGVGPLNDAAMTSKTLRILTISGGGIGFVTRTLTCTFERPNSFTPGA